MNLHRTLILAAAMVAGSALASSAHAQCAGYGGYAAYGPYGYWDIGRLYSVLADEVPYHAAFPPVYYSYPVPRTYGYSPFAYPPGVMTPDVELPGPEVIDNPYVEPKAEEVQPGADTAPADETTSVSREPQPLVIVNPYVTGGKLAASR
jgi:hypothetical protein